VLMMMELIIMSVKVDLIGVGVIMVVHTEINTALGGMKMMVGLMYLITVMDLHVLLASMILMIGVMIVMMKEQKKEQKKVIGMNVMITQTTPIMSVIMMTIITIIIMEMTTTMKLTTIM